MPFPWKKAKVTRISRLVVDLQSPKHGGSLVVETGFPTSLIDLFVKNHDRLWKPSKKKQMKSYCDVAEPPLNSPNTTSSLSCTAPVLCEINTPTCEIGQNGATRVIGDVGEANCLVGDDKIEDGDGVSCANGVLLGVLKIFLVVALALGTKKLAVGITMSAFLLLFLEHVGKHVFCFLRPCSVAQRKLNSLIRRLLILFRRKQGVSVVKEIGEEQSTMPNSCGLAEDLQSSASIEEIQIAESNTSSVTLGEEIQIAEPNFDFLNRDKRWGSRERDSNKVLMEKDEDSCEVSGLQKQRTRSGKLKAKILKKLVPKKLRSSKKERKSGDKEQESSSELFGNMGKCEEQEQQEDGEQDLDDEDRSLSSSSEEEERCGEQAELDVVMYYVDEVLQANVEAAVDRATVGRFTKGNSGYLLLLLIILVGLVGGRILALALTIAWCLMLKSVGLLGRLMNMPMIKSPIQNSS